MKLSQVISLLTLSVIGLMVAWLLIYAKQLDKPAGCGVKDEPKLICGNVRDHLPSTDMSKSLKTVFFKGKDLFENNCSQCHTEFSDIIVGPGLKGIGERRKLTWLVPFIQNSQKMIAEGDTAAINLYNKYDKNQMQSFQLTRQEVKSILFYLANMGQSNVVYLDSLPPNKIID